MNSKRQTLKVQHKIRKKVTQSNRKMKKEAKKAKACGIDLRKAKRKSTKNAMHIPNLWPFKKEELIAQKLAVDRKDAEKIKLAEANKKKIQKEAKQKRAAEQSAPKRPVYKYQSTMDSADLIINVVDARDVLASRCVVNENLKGKKSVIVVTKGDLVPQENLKAWLNYLRRKSGCPVLALTRREDSSKPFGFKNLSKMLQSYEFRFAAVVGYPGVGKHTVESYLKLPSCQLPRKTKTQCASVFEASDLEGLSDDLVLLRKPQAATNPLPVLKRVLERTSSKQDLLIKLALPDFDSAEQLLKSVMHECDCNSAVDAVRQFLKRWSNVGFCTAVPAEGAPGVEADCEPRDRSLTVEDLAALYAEDAKEIAAMHAYIAEVEERLAREMEGDAETAGGVLTSMNGMREQFVDKREFKEMGKKAKKNVIEEKKASSVSSVRRMGQKAVVRPDLARVLEVKAAAGTDGSLLCGGPEPFAFGAAAGGKKDDMDFSDDEEAPALVDMADEDMAEEEEDEEEELDMDDLEMLEEEEEEDGEEMSDAA